MTLPKGLFEVKVSPALLAQAVRVYLSNQRRAHAKTKTRAEVAKTTAKMYKQKGTGRARHGSYAAPIFVGGGISHGPDGKQNYSLRLPFKMRRLALLGALTEKAKEKKVNIFEKMGPVTERTLVVTGMTEDKMRREIRNYENITVVTAGNLNPYVVLVHKQLLITPAALEEMKKYAN
ncbi:50S ribosomal protein L4 [Candidatus Amesbacteria bacterium]|nr:50S ribosomal protein L4 [Candidatus Amesbacteria bacterium]MBI2587583.1 50S ribosomal protein L4 [Candidatus Amesbacteria bacterium]